MKFKLESNGHTPSFELHNHFFQLKTFHFKPFKVIPYRQPIKHPCGYLISVNYNIISLLCQCFLDKKLVGDRVRLAYPLAKGQTMDKS